MKHNVPANMYRKETTLEDILSAPCMKYWRRLFYKELSDINLRQEIIGLFGFFGVCTPQECSKMFNRSLSYVYKLIHAMKVLTTTKPEVVGQMLLDHYDCLEEIMKASPEAAAFIAKHMEMSALSQHAEACRCSNDGPVEIDQDLVDRFILSLAMECQSSNENISVCLEAVLGISLSPSKIRDILAHYEKIGCEKAKELDIIVFPKIAAIALDEIFLSSIPIFTVVDLDSTYSILIKPKKDRKTETWEEELKVLRSLGLNPKIIVSDACGSILVATPETFEDAIILIDVFHILKDLGDCIRKFIRKLEYQDTYKKDIDRRIDNGVNVQAQTLQDYYDLNDDILPYINQWIEELETVRSWIIELLGWSGYTCHECKELIEWCLDELGRLADKPMKLCSGIKKKKGKNPYPPVAALHREIEKFRGHKERTMQYLSIFFQNLAAKSEEEQVSNELLEQAYRLRRYVDGCEAYHEAKKKACHQMRCSWQDMSKAEELVSSVIEATPRASSLVENLNSRIRPTLSKRRSADSDFLGLKRLYLNLRPYRRSRKAERKGKSPYELVTGDAGMNFFSLLGLSVAKPAIISA